MTKQKLVDLGPESKPLHKALRKLVANACKHCFHIGLGFTELLEGSITLCAGLGVSASTLGVVVAPVESGVIQGIHGSVDGLVGSVVFLLKGIPASAVEVDGRNGGHGLKGGEALASMKQQ